MNKNQAKKKIYIRTFAALLAAYLVLMAGFSIFLLKRQEEVERVKLQTSGLQNSMRIENVLQGHMDSNYKITNTGQLRKDLIMNPSTDWDLEWALFSGDYELLFNTNDYWRCSYTEYKVGNRGYIGYGQLNPWDWFDEDEVIELENYLYVVPKVKKAGDLVGYGLSLEGFWVEEDLIIPDQIRVTAIYAEKFDEEGNVSLAGGNQEAEIVYLSNYEDTKGLPYFEHGGIQPGRRSNDRSILLRSMVLDQKMLRESAEQTKVLFSEENVSLVTRRYYMLMPYQNGVTVLADSQNYYSQFWTAYAGEVNLWDQCAGTLIFVWLSCLAAFLIVALILSRETYRIYREREALDQQRSETVNALAHDLKTPLSIISGYAQNLMENVQTEKREHYARHIYDNVSRMDEIIRSMLELSKLETNQLEIKYEKVPIHQVCNRLISRYGQLCDERQIQASLAGEAIIQADLILMERVLDNFFVNALNWTPEGGDIQIKIQENTLEFFNSGSHISEEEIEEIWQPFKKADASRGHRKGTGLGLSISSKILALYQFSYGVQNVENGVVFWFKWQ